ncbi:hypothetical protein HDU87_006169 [Geranomyces variabilis]|uniref:Uncharacterized protein n=1 Tax=Geranomyces variabilis TaxID=109894 RepID=A0AAD5TLE8_9FUNG|nr:hypothetical protein HDU87_006169 [Geranomyces variabilis]
MSETSSDDLQSARVRPVSQDPVVSRLDVMTILSIALAHTMLRNKDATVEAAHDMERHVVRAELNQR